MILYYDKLVSSTKLQYPSFPGLIQKHAFVYVCLKEHSIIAKMSKYQPPKTAAVGVPILNKQYYMQLVPGGSLELNIGEYDYGWYSCKCVAVSGSTDDDCAFIMEFDEAYQDTRFNKGWKFDDKMEQDAFDIADNGRCLFYEGLLAKEDGFSIRSTKKNTRPFITTGALIKQQDKDEVRLGLKEKKKRKRRKFHYGFGRYK